MRIMEKYHERIRPTNLFHVRWRLGRSNVCRGPKLMEPVGISSHSQPGDLEGHNNTSSVPHPNSKMFHSKELGCILGSRWPVCLLPSHLLGPPQEWEHLQCYSLQPELTLSLWVCRLPQLIWRSSGAIFEGRCQSGGSGSKLSTPGVSHCKEWLLLAPWEIWRWLYHLFFLSESPQSQ